MQINFAFCMTILNCWYRTTENWQISWGISFHTNASTSVAVTNGTSFFYFSRTCSYLMLHYIKIPNLVLYDLGWLFTLKTHWVAEESERLICELYTKTKFHKIYVVQQLLTNILSMTKTITAVLEILSILAMFNWIQCCTNFNLLNLMLHFVLPFHCSASFNFQALFLLFRV